MKKLCKSKNGSKLCGVCTGISLYTSIDVTIVRLIFIALAIFGGPGILLYIICAVVMPEESDYIDYTYYDNDDERNK